MTVDSFTAQTYFIEHQLKSLQVHSQDEEDDHALEEGEIREGPELVAGLTRQKSLEPVAVFDEGETLEEGQIRETGQSELDDEISFKPPPSVRAQAADLGLGLDWPSSCLAETTLVFDMQEEPVSVPAKQDVSSSPARSLSTYSPVSGAGYETPPRLVHGGKEEAVEIYYTSPTKLNQATEPATEPVAKSAMEPIVAKRESLCPPPPPPLSTHESGHATDMKLELLQAEIESLQVKYNASLQSIANLKGVLSEYESAMSSMIAESQAMRSEQLLLLAASQEENERLQKELTLVVAGQQELKQRYDDMKIISDGFRKNEEMLRKNIDSLSSDLVSSERRYEGLKMHAEEKLEGANQEISRVRSTFEKDISAFKIKLAKAELSISSLQATIDQKTKENKELMNICDELIQKMDASASA